MKYCIMCGGYYQQFETPKHLLEINGEKVVERTIRLLRENGITDIVITATDERFDELGVPRIEHENTYRQENGTQYGYWLDAFYDFGEPTAYIFGDVYFNDEAITKIVNCTEGNILFGTGFALYKGRGWGEPFAYVVNDTATFFEGIAEVKKLQDSGYCCRMPVVWELYRFLNGIDVNYHEVKETTYRAIDDGTIDIDTGIRYEQVKSEVETGRKVSVIIPVYNRKKLLQRAIASVPKRCDLEIIVVDDGSTDGTADDIETTENLKVIHTDHAGVSNARNVGIENARGKYILFLDSDDYILTDNYYVFDLWLHNPNDIIYFNLELNNGDIYKLNNDSKYFWCGTTKFIKKDFIGDVRFPIGVDKGEDLIFFNELQKKAPTEIFSDKTLIHYNHPRVEI